MSETFEILGVKVSNPNWDGTPTVMAVDDSLIIPQTPNGTMIVAFQNQSKRNNDGQVTLTSGGSSPTPIDVPALIAAPTVLSNNWQASNLNTTNTSAASDTPIWAEALGPGLSPVPGQLSVGTAVTLKPYAAVQGISLPRWMQLKLIAGTGDLTIVAVIGGPPNVGGNNAYIYALNWSGPTPPPPAMGYTAVTGGNAYTMQFNWSSSVVWVANMSPSTASPVSVLMRAL